MKNINILVDELVEVSKKSLDNGDVPVGALLVKDGKIIARGFNTRERDKNILGHAEINVILDGSKYFDNWNLDGCDLYVTLYPCQMCIEVIKQSRIRNIYYLLDKPGDNQEFSKSNFKKIEVINNNFMYQKILSDFFENLRKK